MAKAGDRVWLLKQGRGPKGIFGAGLITGPTFRGDAGNGKVQWMAPVRFEALVDPKQYLLIGDEVVAEILRQSQIEAPASGYPLDDDQSNAFEQRFSKGQTVELGGTGDWTPLELRAIVADYFAMLDAELAGQPYSKTAHRNALRKTVDRSPGSIERKHENISAVLQELGLPWINGYKPLPNFQDALVDAVDAQLSQNVAKLDEAAAAITAPPAKIDSIFVAPPPPTQSKSGDKRIARLIGKFDPAARDAANRKLGKAGEEFVLKLEIDRLAAAGRADLSAKVNWASKNIGDGLGYDIESFTKDGDPIVIEVKTTRGSISTPFYISKNEIRISRERQSSYWLYRLFGFGKEAHVYKVPGPLDKALALEPINYRARIGS